MVTDKGRINFATGKTPGETYEDFIEMGRIAAEYSLMLNGNGALIARRKKAAEKEVEENAKTEDTFSIYQLKEGDKTRYHRFVSYAD